MTKPVHLPGRVGVGTVTGLSWCGSGPPDWRPAPAWANHLGRRRGRTRWSVTTETEVDHGQPTDGRSVEQLAAILTFSTGSVYSLTDIARSANLPVPPRTAWP